MATMTESETPKEVPAADAFDFCGRKIAKAFIATAQNLDKMEPGFRAAGFQTLEELWMRLTGCDLNVDDLLLEDALFRAWQEREKIQ